MTPLADDRTLLARFNAIGDRDALDELVRKYVHQVYGSALRQTGDPHAAEDVTQAVFVVFISKAKSMTDAAHLPGWFFQTTRYAVNNHLKQARRRAFYERQAAREADMTLPDPNHSASLLPELDEALATLSAADRNLVLLRHFHDAEIGQIGQSLGLSESTARKRLTRAIERLRKFFDGRGKPLATAGVTSLLALAATQTAPAALAGSIAATALAGGTAGSAILAKGVLSIMTWSKFKTVGVIIAALLAGGGAIELVRQVAAKPAPLTPPAVAPAKFETKDQAKRALDIEYALKPSEVLRVIDPPFSPARTAFADFEFPYAKGANRIRSIGFRWNETGMSWNYMSYVDQSFAGVATDSLREPWYTLEGLDQIKAPPIHGDIIVRENVPVQQKFEALAALIQQRTGQPVRLGRYTKMRPCIVLNGPTRKGADNGKGFFVVVLSPTAVSTATAAAWGGTDFIGRRNAPSGSTHAFDFDRASQYLAAPFFRTNPGPNDEFSHSPLFIVTKEARLNPTDPNYQADLRKIVDNIAAQVGGDWRIEEREIETFYCRAVRPYPMQ